MLLRPSLVLLLILLPVSLAVKEVIEERIHRAADGSVTFEPLDKQAPAAEGTCTPTAEAVEKKEEAEQVIGQDIHLRDADEPMSSSEMLLDDYLRGPKVLAQPDVDTAPVRSAEVQALLFDMLKDEQGRWANATFAPLASSWRPRGPTATYMHLPMLEVDGDADDPGLAVRVHGAKPGESHPMSPDQHVAAVWVLDGEGQMVYSHRFLHGNVLDTTSPGAVAFVPPAGFGDHPPLTPYALTNMDGAFAIWQGPGVRLRVS